MRIPFSRRTWILLFALSACLFSQTLFSGCEEKQGDLSKIAAPLRLVFEKSFQNDSGMVELRYKLFGDPDVDYAAVVEYKTGSTLFQNATQAGGETCFVPRRFGPRGGPDFHLGRRDRPGLRGTSGHA